MRRLAATLVAFAALTACAPDLPDLEGPTGPETDGAPIDATVTAAASAAGLQACPARGPADATDLAEVTLVCVGSGEPADLGALAGTPTVVNVWASWCVECREELPLLAKAARQYEGRVRFVGVIFADERPLEAIELARASGVTYPLFADPGGALQQPLGLRGFPQNVFLDAEGTRVGTEYGAFLDYDDLTDAIESQLGVEP